MKYSLIIPVYNRPAEIRDLLESLKRQSYRDFETIIVEDGSSSPCDGVVSAYMNGGEGLDLHYFSKENSGPGGTRNYGAEKAGGEYLIFLDSDVTVPGGYFEAMDKELENDPADAFGGPDRADNSFTPVQKAINYSMTSFFTTGGIRGGKKKLDRFYPRSFNMGIRKYAFEDLGGFSDMRYGEDIDLSIRIFKAGYRCRLFPEAWVVHKRRTDFKQFFRQVRHSGMARIELYIKYPDSLRPVHLLPSAFTIASAALLLAGFQWHTAWFLLFLYAFLIFTDSSWKNGGDMKTGILSVVAAFVQLNGYGTGFIEAWWRRCVLKKD